MIKTVLITIAAIGVIGLAYYGVYTWNQNMKNQAVDACINSGKVVTVIDQDIQKQTYSMPDGAWYEKCMTDKGYSVGEQK